MKIKYLPQFGFFFYLVLTPMNLFSQSEGISSDQDSNAFSWKRYNNQYWSIKNAEVKTYRDGTIIPQVSENSEWKNLTTGAWCYSDNDSQKGVLYNWYAIMGIHDNDPNTPNKEFSPVGWSVPSFDQWSILIDYLGGDSVAGKKMKEIGNLQDGTGEWSHPNSGNNSSGFSALPFGYRTAYDGSFKFISSFAYWWHKSDDNILPYGNIGLWNHLDEIHNGNDGKNAGLSVRFIRDSSLEIILNGTVSAEDNQIKNVSDPTDPQDVLTLNYFNSISDKDPELGPSDNQISDIDGNTYDTVKINSVVWSESNLRVKTYRDGTPIQQATSENFESISAGAWAYVNDDPSTEVEYGLLYNFACVTNPKGLAPKGTRIPTKIDFFNLMNSVMNGDSIEDGFHRIKSESGWIYNGVNYNGNNSSGFNLKPAGRIFTDSSVFGALTEIHTSDLFNQTYNNQYFNTRFKVQFNSNSNYFNDNYHYSSVRVILN